jgi:transcriptional regulator with XRE-family HTH domain
MFDLFLQKYKNSVAKYIIIEILCIFATQKEVKKRVEMNTITGRNLKALREANGYTQEKMAEYLGVGRSAYANYEAGERETPLDVLQKAADLFGCELALLFEEDETAVRNMLVCAFRADDLSADDMREVASFKSVVMNYLKMERLLGK